MLLTEDGRGNQARKIFMAMKVGDIIHLEPEDWKRASQVPRTYLLQLSRKTKRTWKCMTLLDGSGWVVERIG